MSPMIIRDMLPHEADRVGQLHNQIHALHVNGRPDWFAPNYDNSADMMRWFADQSNSRVLVAVREDAILGYAVIDYLIRNASPYSLPRRCVHVQEICVDEAAKRCGAGRALMEYIYEDARQRSYPRVELDVWAFNEDAYQFYHAIGMQDFRHYLEYQVFPHRFARLSMEHVAKAVALYGNLKGLPGCTWDEGYPNQEIVESDIQHGYLYGAIMGDELLAVGAALPDEELNHLDCWQILAQKPCVFSRIGVALSHQGQGLAGQMVRYMEEEMRLSGYDAVRMLVSPGNEKALHVYRSCGYQECGSTRMYEEDWLCMEKKLW
ncbi:MAG: GNAT family N-acetyltransferase [Clostridia bacterium]|nr:GNAT family N-acetyltransferase [Clostridia bacterium]MBP3648985.1 GNAT family N-acetyltransferase [Clostridia bacterium]